MRIVLAIICLFCFALSLCAQQGNPKDFYPMQVGNVWQYNALEGAYPYPVTYTITRDTVMPNGRKYYLFDGGFYRILRMDDSLNVYLYQDDHPSGEILLDKLGAKPGDKWTSFEGTWLREATMVEYREAVIFGDTVEVRRISYKHSIDKEMQYADTFGPFYRIIEGPIYYSLIGAIINGKRYGNLVVSNVEPIAAPVKFHVSQNYPNPFNPSTTIRYSVGGSNGGQAVFVRLVLYNILGQEVKTLVASLQEPGSYHVTWDGTDNGGKRVPSGVYIYRLIAGSYVSAKTMVLVK